MMEVVLDVAKKVTSHVNVPKEVMAALNAVKKAIWLENAQVVNQITPEKDKEMTMETEMEVATSVKDLMMKTTRITNGD